ncbi:MAG TPA: hypothetical protein VHH53_08305, partial [Pseudonocardiaceae bacterium]|nr:hypothetical protein [Pseudonocardiaceae bacterium]
MTNRGRHVVALHSGSAAETRTFTAYRGRLAEVVLDRGGAVLLFGDHQAGWPAHARWTFRPAGGAGQATIGTTW